MADCGPNRLTRTRYGLMIYNRHDRYIGRSLERYGEFSEGNANCSARWSVPARWWSKPVRTSALIRSCCRNWSVRGGASIAIEPQRVVFQILCGNLALNGCLNVDCRALALGHQAGQLFVPPIDYQQENNFGGVELRQEAVGNPFRSSPWTVLQCPPAIF
jgi:hypothetical protein